MRRWSLTRFGFKYFEVLERLGQRVEVVNLIEDKDSELMDDFVAIVTSFCGRIYGSQRKKKTKQIIEELKEECQNDKK